jgi:hypothetical protein
MVSGCPAKETGMCTSWQVAASVVADAGGGAPTASAARPAATARRAARSRVIPEYRTENFLRSSFLRRKRLGRTAGTICQRTAGWHHPIGALTSICICVEIHA